MFTPNQYTQLELSPRFATIQHFLLSDSKVQFILSGLSLQSWDYLPKNRPRHNPSSVCYPWRVFNSKRCMWSIRVCSSLCVGTNNKNNFQFPSPFGCRAFLGNRCSQVGNLSLQWTARHCCLPVITYLCHCVILLLCSPLSGSRATWNVHKT